MITQNFNLNLIPDSAPVVVHVDQYDVGEGRFVIKLMNGDTPYTPVGATAVIQGMKPDGHGFIYAATISGNTVTADLVEQMSIVAGNVRCQLVITDADDRTGTFVFIIAVQKSALPADSDMSTSDYQLVEDLIITAESINTNPPKIGTNGNWWIWDVPTMAYVDSGVDASITVNIADITMLSPDATPYVTNTGTNTDPVFHLFIPRGQTGATGPAAGFGTPTASVDANVGTPSVDINASGPDTAKVFNFQFHNLKGATGDTGATGAAAGFGTITASVDANTGTPSVDVTASGPDTAKVLDFQFHNLKGETGTDANAVHWADNNILGAKNQLYHNLTSGTLNSMVVTVDSDGGIKLTGAPTQDTAVRYDLTNEEINNLLGKKWIFTTGIPYNNQTANITINIKINGVTNYIKNGDILDLTNPNNTYTNLIFSWWVPNGITPDNNTCYPMIRLYNDTDNNYERFAMTNQKLTENILPKIYQMTHHSDYENYFDWTHVITRYHKVGHIVEIIIDDVKCTQALTFPRWTQLFYDMPEPISGVSIEGVFLTKNRDSVIQVQYDVRNGNPLGVNKFGLSFTLDTPLAVNDILRGHLIYMCK